MKLSEEFRQLFRNLFVVFTIVAFVLIVGGITLLGEEYSPWFLLILLPFLFLTYLFTRMDLNRRYRK